MSAPATIEGQACRVRNCSGTYVVFDTTTQHGTGDHLYRAECSANHRHRAWLIGSLGVLHKTTATRWERSKLTGAK